jgi:hypothetical protein
MDINPTWEDPEKAWKVPERIGSSPSPGRIGSMEEVGLVELH